MSPTKLLIHAAGGWYRQQGVKTLHLGGGLGAGNDSLFQFKAGFSKKRALFHTCRIILNKDRYDALTAMHQKQTGLAQKEATDYFPAYRAPF